MSYFGIPIRNGLPIGLGSVAPLASGGGSPFSPLSLFSGGAPGAWYDPSDYGATGTLFQDSAGTTPVTAVEQPVGLMLDKSQGLVLGPELVTNGDFSNGSTGWTQISGTFTFSSGRAIAANSDSIKRLSSTASSMVAGRWYVITWNQYAGAGTGAANWTIPGVWSGTDNFANGGNYVNGEGLKTLYYLAPVSGQFYFYNFEQAVEYDNISVKELAGNHAFQATSASRPVLSARYNLLTKTEQFDDAAWVKRGTATITADAVLAPNGTMTADLVSGLGALGSNDMYYSGTITGSPATTVALSPFFYIKKVTTTGTLRLQNAGGNAYGVWLINLGLLSTDWEQITSSHPAVTVSTVYTGSGGSTAGPQFNSTGAALSFYIWGASLVPSNQSTLPYQRVNTATDYATTGFLPYLKFDGVDDSLSTNSISFTSTDKMSVFAGVRKLSDAAAAIVAELSAVASTNNGAFYVAAPDSPATYGFGLRGTTSINRNASTYTAPITNVLAASFDIAQATPATEVTIRINAATPGTIVNGGVSDAGTGNFGNFPLYIGRRNNASLPFNGQMYSMIIVGKAVTAGELSSTETYVNQKTGAYA